MPTVKSYDGPQIEERAGPNIAGAMGGLTGGREIAQAQQTQAKQVGQVADALGNIEEAVFKAADKDAQAVAMGELGKLQSTLAADRQRMKSEDVLGKADGLPDRASKWYDEQVQKSAGAITNERARAYFENKARGEYRATYMEGVTAHAEQQRQQVITNGFIGAIQGHTDSALTANTPAIRENELEQAALAAAQYARDRLGASTKEEIDDVVQKQMSPAYANIALQFIQAGDATSAAQFLGIGDPERTAQVRSRMTADAYDRLVSAVKKDKNTQDGYAIGRKFAMAGKSIDEATKEATQGMTVGSEDYRTTVNGVQQSFGDIEQGRRLNADNAERAVWQYAAKNGGFLYGVPDALIDAVARFDPGRAAMLQRERQSQIENRTQNGTPYTSQQKPGEFNKVYGLVASGDVKTREDLQRYAGGLTKSEYNEIEHALEVKDIVRPQAVNGAFRAQFGEWQGDDRKTELHNAFVSYVYQQAAASPDGKVDMDEAAARFALEGVTAGGVETTFGKAVAKGQEAGFTYTPPDNYSGNMSGFVSNNKAFLIRMQTALGKAMRDAQLAFAEAKTPQDKTAARQEFANLKARQQRTADAVATMPSLADEDSVTEFYNRYGVGYDLWLQDHIAAGVTPSQNTMIAYVYLRNLGVDDPSAQDVRSLEQFITQSVTE